MDFCLLLKNMGKTLSNKYGQKLLDSAKKLTTDAIKATLKREIQKTAEATGGLIGNKTADKMTSVSKTSSMELHSKELQNNEANDKIEIPKKKIHISRKRKQIIDEFWLV